jgi:CheY-like chemotaxis protein
VTKKTILVVEDEEIERKLLSEVLETLEYKVAKAQNGREALEIIGSQHVDLILTDVHMPEINGLELIRRVRETGNNLPVIIMTGFDASEAQKCAEKYQAAALLLKPFRLQELREILAKIL